MLHSSQPPPYRSKPPTQGSQALRAWAHSSQSLINVPTPQLTLARIYTTPSKHQKPYSKTKHNQPFPALSTPLSPLKSQIPSWHHILISISISQLSSRTCSKSTKNQKKTPHKTTPHQFNSPIHLSTPVYTNYLYPTPPHLPTTPSSRNIINSAHSHSIQPVKPSQTPNAPAIYPQSILSIPYPYLRLPPAHSI